ncbi:MAG TPA: hypothetical protein VEC01_15020 [Noviherbaspirillum sp.]|uniref:hypothetical protein n=1 Tax=Noviherbaspirillum sp. TaxID=1926288 RepID=UPI002D393042|nr:hypothetical protein [Noviherbaspirillum sp.]HYD96639.1 hypothetical protein [Noviherbaspirillum sp.]
MQNMATARRRRKVRVPRAAPVRTAPIERYQKRNETAFTLRDVAPNYKQEK